MYVSVDVVFEQKIQSSKGNFLKNTTKKSKILNLSVKSLVKETNYFIIIYYNYFNTYSTVTTDVGLGYG